MASRVEELAQILRWVPTLHVECTGGSPTREASQTVSTWAYNVPDYDEMARAALAWMAERVPHLTKTVRDDGQVSYIVVANHYYHSSLMSEDEKKRECSFIEEVRPLSCTCFKGDQIIPCPVHGRQP